NGFIYRPTANEEDRSKKSEVSSQKTEGVKAESQKTRKPEKKPTQRPTLNAQRLNALTPQRLIPSKVYLLARVTEAHLENGQLHIATSFPVPFQSRMLTGETPLRGYVDCKGAVFAEDFRLAPLPEGEKGAKRLRFGQNSPDVARVVVELE